MNSDPLHRARFHQLWIDKARDQLKQTPLMAELDRTVRLETLSRLTNWNVTRIRALSPEELREQFAKFDLLGTPPESAIRQLKSMGFPQKQLRFPEDWFTCQPKVNAAMNWSCFQIMSGPATHILLLDDKTASSVVHSKNEPATAAELQHLPYNPCLIEFYRPIEVVEKLKRGVRLRAVGFHALGTESEPVATVCFFLDYWESLGQLNAKLPVTINIWFGGINCVEVGEAAYKQIGIERGSTTEAGIIEACKLVARNLWDFVTSRSIRYEHFDRKPLRHSANGDSPKAPTETDSSLDRRVTFLFLSRDCKTPSAETGESRPPARPWDHRIEIPGTFHEYVYCAKCGDLHRHDLLGQSCRKCGEVVGPRKNLRVEKYWHCPHLKGPEGTPLMDVVRDVRRKKKGTNK